MTREYAGRWAGLAATRNTGMDDREEARLVAAARADPRDFAPLYERYVGRVFGYCYLRLGTRADAEDATGQVFLNALAAIGRYRDGSFAGWLFRIAHNVVADMLRRRRPATPLDIAPDLPDRSLPPDEQAASAQERVALRQAVTALPEPQRQAVELHLAGWSLQQTAAALGKTPEAVHALRYRAVRQLRAALGAANEGDGT